VVPGRLEPTPEGDCFVSERRLPAEAAHGAMPLASALTLSPRARQLLARAAPEALEPHRALFLDTETTGLSGGTGTYAFLVGLGYFEGGEFHVRQYFMRHPGEEPALLHAVREVLAGFPVWVTFNGKAFDVPLLETRFLYGRRITMPRPSFHLDALHPARRLWRSRLPSCALASLERALLGVERSDDVPSWLIPSLYFDYVRRGRCEPLLGVFEHNVFDLLSLATLVGLLGQVLDEPWRFAARADAVALLRLYCEAGLAHEAATWCEQVLESVAASERASLHWELATLLRRHGNLDGAANHWQRLAAEPGPWAALAQIELAKHYEHRARDYAAATRAAEAALAALALSRAPTAQAQRVSLERRLGRLYYRAHRPVARPTKTRSPRPSLLDAGS
jgi:uncharacterized protein YprB with RNaseH-like and TPR domain